MLAKVISGTTIGLKGIQVEVEVDVAGRGFPTFTIVGLPNKSIDEAKERVRTAITNAGFEMPDSRITVNLAPADIPKSGSGFDLAIAVGILSASGLLNGKRIGNSMFLGELSLEAKVRKVSGIISLLIFAQEQGIEQIYMPEENIDEARMLDGLNIIPVSTLSQLLDHLRGINCIPSHHFENNEEQFDDSLSSYDFSDIKGQEQAKRALEIAAAGFHNVHMRGVPGAGKTLLSRSFPSILPYLSPLERLEVAKIYSAIGEVKKSIFFGIRPFRAPHHTTSRVGLIGGGSLPLPGEISLSHRGVLFLDEFPEFPRNVLESLRQPLEDGVVTISRAAGSLTFPARFLLLAASNPCPCGFLGHPQKPCMCSQSMILRYKKRLSGPLLDRIDIHITIPPVEVEKLSDHFQSESSSSIRKRILGARELQFRRFDGKNIQFNGEMGSQDIKDLCVIDSKAKDLLIQAVQKLSLSARSYFKTIKVAQTISDLEGTDHIERNHIAESLQYRSQE